MHFEEIDLGSFSERVKLVLKAAHDEANRRNHNFIGTEHLLLGIINSTQVPGADILERYNLDPKTVWIEVGKQVGTGPERAMAPNLPFTPRTKKVLILAVKEADALNHEKVDIRHLLLGLMKEGDGVAARVLLHMGLTYEIVRDSIWNKLAEPPAAVNIPGSNSSDLPVEDLFILSVKTLDIATDPKTQVFGVVLKQDKESMKFTFTTEDQVNAFIEGLSACAHFHGRDLRLPKWKRLG